MADITTREQYERTFKVYQTGVTERGTKADRATIGDFTVAMTCPNGVPRQPQLSKVARLMSEKGFTIGHPKTKKTQVKRQTKTQIKKEAAMLLKETGADSLPNIPSA